MSSLESRITTGLFMRYDDVSHSLTKGLVIDSGHHHKSGE